MCVSSSTIEVLLVLSIREGGRGSKQYHLSHTGPTEIFPVFFFQNGILVGDAGSHGAQNRTSQQPGLAACRRLQAACRSLQEEQPDKTALMSKAHAQMTKPAFLSSKHVIGPVFGRPNGFSFSIMEKTAGDLSAAVRTHTKKAGARCCMGACRLALNYLNQPRS